jgi:hypothetical protein
LEGLINNVEAQQVFMPLDFLEAGNKLLQRVDLVNYEFAFAFEVETAVLEVHARLQKVLHFLELDGEVPDAKTLVVCSSHEVVKDRGLGLKIFAFFL